MVKGVVFPNNDCSFMFVPSEIHIVYTLFSICTYDTRRESKLSFAVILIEAAYCLWANMIQLLSCSLVFTTTYQLRVDT